ncbi:NmrA family NAD(P)-binding protein [Streptomyces sp. DSM 44915]|uniref:NmrA family NAD(P)-binding protein n=1 Tax=Streptomyces chisholmiae TaxID=3075540 RepID=A0ABU2JPF9_9ACTN|nr:NmrA family NAD(P)-binding protein [Streptomyces sp. DSM 44915]MDT0266882.1 NmrA family NAD(P)-binding protein [Streptomyces sp. DSM 44915]
MTTTRRTERTASPSFTDSEADSRADSDAESRTDSGGGRIDAGRVLVVGGTGKSGRRVAALLPGARVGSRGGSPAFDWDQPADWPAVLTDIEAVYLSYPTDIAAPGAAERLARFARVAAERGVRRLVLLSGRGMPWAADSERAVTASGLEWTVLRGSWFAQNFSEEFVAEEVRRGSFTLPVPATTAEPFVDLDDLAEVAVAALTRPGHAGRVYALTGPRALDMTEVAETLSAALGRPVVFRSVAPDAYRRQLVALGLPAAEAELLTHLFTEIFDGRNTPTSDDIPTVLGRPARDLAAYAHRAATAGAWPAPEAAATAATAATA